jgi:photosystem II stability/assembly factor-like uncharacterized protein
MMGWRAFLALAAMGLARHAAAVGWVNIGPPGGADTRALLVNGATIYAGTSGHGLLTSADGGRTWLPASIAASSVFALVQNPTLLFAGTDRGVFTSTAPGTVWQRRGDTLAARSVYTLAVIGTAWFAGTDAGLFRSNDQGTTWMAVAGVPTVSVLALAFTQGSVVLAGTQAGVFASADGGSSWVAHNSGLDNYTVDVLVADTADGSVFYAGARYTGPSPGPAPPSGGVFKTSNGGITWTPINQGLQRTDAAPPPILALAINSEHVLYLGTQGAGVFQSSDGGQTWVANSTGLTDLQVQALTGAPAGLYAGTASRGVFLLSSAAAVGTLTGLIPVVISAPGAHSAFFRTALQLTNTALACSPPCTSGVPIVGQLAFHPQGVASPADPLLTFTLEAGQTLMLSDVVDAFETVGVGTLDIVTPPNNVPIATAEVFTATGAIGSLGMFGFTEQSMSPGDALRAGDAGVLLSPPYIDARQNFGVRTFADGATVQLTVRDQAGNVRSTFSREFPSNYMAQVSAADFLTPPGASTAYALTHSYTVRIDVVIGSLIAYAVAADNTTNDSSFQLARKLQ